MESEEHHTHLAARLLSDLEIGRNGYSNKETVCLLGYIAFEIRDCGSVEFIGGRDSTDFRKTVARFLKKRLALIATVDWWFYDRGRSGSFEDPQEAIHCLLA